jgi:NAD(P)-dependent dehydrogenase (short-subunit alcohol dehydrogenase family)
MRGIKMEFDNKVVLITGGGGSIGKAVARRFLEEGASVVLNSRRQEVLDAAKEELDSSGERVELFIGDASRPETASRFVAAAVERFGGVDVLVNSTGIFRVKPFEEETEADFEEAMNSILRPTFYTSQAAVPEMRKRGGGAIVSVGSMWAVDASPPRPPAPTRPPRPDATLSPRTSLSSWRRTTSGSIPSRSRSSRHLPTSGS